MGKSYDANEEFVSAKKPRTFKGKEKIDHPKRKRSLRNNRSKSDYEIALKKDELAKESKMKPAASRRLSPPLSIGVNQEATGAGAILLDKSPATTPGTLGRRVSPPQSLQSPIRSRMSPLSRRTHSEPVSKSGPGSPPTPTEEEVFSTLGSPFSHPTP